MARHRAIAPAPRHIYQPKHGGLSRRRPPVGRFTLALAGLLAASVTAALLGPSDEDRPAAASVPVNLVVDPEFHHGTAAWQAIPGATVSVVSGHAGHRAVAIRNSSTAARTFNLNDRVNTVSTTQVGARYVASAWVRVDRPAPSAAIREGAWKKSQSQGAPALKSVWLRTAAWQHVTITYIARVTGASIDLNVLIWQLARGATFYVSQPTLLAYAANGTPLASPTTASPSPSKSSGPPASSSTTPKASAGASSSVPAPSRSATSSFATPSSGASPSASSTGPAPSSITPRPTESSTAPPGMRMVFDDEFNGTGVDRSKWNVRNNDYASNEESIVTDRKSNVFVSDGVLTLRALRETYSTGSTQRSYTSGYLDSIGRFSQQYGRWAMRAELPTAKGMWPAFWLRSDHSPGEIDILEAIGGLPTMAVQTAFPSTNDGSVKKTHRYDFASGSGIADWHVYGLSWTPTSISWDIDGKTIFTLTSQDAAWVATAFRDTMNIRLNLQVGGSMPGYFNKQVDSSTALPADYRIDWVRAYA